MEMKAATRRDANAHRAATEAPTKDANAHRAAAEAANAYQAVTEAVVEAANARKAGNGQPAGLAKGSQGRSGR